MNDRPADSGDPNRYRDKSKDVHICVEGSEAPSAIVYMGLEPPKVQWCVYGPQDAEHALQIAEGVVAALKGYSPKHGVAAPRDTADVGATSAKPAKPRAMSVAFREHIAAGLDDEQIWDKIVEEFKCGKEHRTRIKEYRREMTPPPAGAQYLLDSSASP